MILKQKIISDDTTRQSNPKRHLNGKSKQQENHIAALFGTYFSCRSTIARVIIAEKKKKRKTALITCTVHQMENVGLTNITVNVLWLQRKVSQHPNKFVP